ncbi:MAG: BMP family ABC transporter substrate-binding protein [candidate division NC10 bacterium]|nr:BMP family ABC transporter substrate-binding protein [candidate division NC10 bacterium]
MRKRTKQTRMPLGVVGLIVVFLVSFGILLRGATAQEKKVPSKDEKLKVGFVYVGPRDDYGYNYAHDQGRLCMEKKLGWVETLHAENIPESADVERVMEQMIRQGAKLIFPTSYGYLDPAINVAKRHNDVIFMHAGGFKTAPNLGTYWAYIYNAMYLSGIAAGKLTKTNKLGFVAAHPIPQVLGNINALTLGARSVNPKVETHVVFTGGWYNPGKEAEAANSLVDLGVDVLTQHQDSPIAVVQTAEKRGVYAVGYHSKDLQKFAPKGWLTGASWNWCNLYADLAKEVKDGKWKGGHRRGGLETGYFELAPFGAAVPNDVRDMVMKKRKEILDGKYVVFQGPVKDNKGTLRVKAGEKPTFERIEQMDWFVEGVVGTVPK